MSLSKIYRGAETDGLQQFQFRSFGEVDPVVALDPGAVAPAVLVDRTATAPPPAPAAAGLTERDLEEAYARGRREGLAAAEEQLDGASQALASALEEVCRLRAALVHSSKQDMLRLVMAVAEQIIRREASVDPEVVVSIIENALQASVRADHYRVRVNPEDLAKVTEKKPFFLASISGLKNLSIEPDSGISSGGCRVDSELGEVDATLETQLESIRQALGEAIAEG